MRGEIKASYRAIVMPVSVMAFTAALLPPAHADVFSNAGQGAVDYSQANQSAQVSCAQMVAKSDFRVTVVSAKAIPGSD